jgi:polyphosphate:AMP phosphotransferase
MFEAVELGRRIPKQDYEQQLPALRTKLIEAQQAVRQAGFPVLIIIAGMDGADKGEVVHHLNEWLDPRGIDTHTFWNPSTEEEERPRYWRFWRTLPARGRIGIYFGAWYNDLLQARTCGRISAVRLESELARIAAFERMLVEDGALIVKFWCHLSEKDQRRRLKARRKTPDRGLVVEARGGKPSRFYAKFVAAGETIIRRTDTGFAPWRLVESVQDRYRDLAAGQLLLEALQAKLAQRAKVKPSASKSKSTHVGRVRATVLDTVDLTRSLSKKAYGKQLPELQAKLNRLTWKAFKRKMSSLLVFEGWDAAGKGSAIRRITEAVDARLFRVVPVAAPSEEERAQHYLWRFWRQLPRAGMVTIFDRSWYGRVLVERVEGFAARSEWQRAYHEINEFERQLAEHGIVVLKFWLHISAQEQLERFRKREQVAHKNYKITAEDYRNRKQWAQYEQAVHDMVSHTSTQYAPWSLISGNDKQVARVDILRTFIEALEKSL